MKKSLAFLCALALSASALFGCSGSQGASASSAAETTTEAQTTAAETTAEETTAVSDVTENDAAMNIMALKGPTAMGMVEFMNAADSGELTDGTYNFTIAASADEVTPKIVKGEADIAAVPANLASVLYNNTEGGVKVLAVNTLGVLYIVENGEGGVSSVADLKGKTIYASGKGATPEYALNYILNENGIDPETDVTIEWKSEHAECLAALLADENSVAMLPQPFVTTAQMKNENVKVALDLTKEWDQIQADEANPSALITGVVIARTAYMEDHPEAISAFLTHYQDSVTFVNSDVTAAAALVGKYDIVPEAVALQAIPACNITFITNTEMKDKLSGYLNVLFEQNPKSVGGELPADDFYYTW